MNEKLEKLEKLKKLLDEGVITRTEFELEKVKVMKTVGIKEIVKYFICFVLVIICGIILLILYVLFFFKAF